MVLLLALLGGPLIAGCSRESPAQTPPAPERNPAHLVEIAVVERDTLGSTAVYNGTLRSRRVRDASTRLDRARRLLPTSIDQPAIFKRDPPQIPVAELVVSSRLRDAARAC